MSRSRGAWSIVERAMKLDDLPIKDGFRQRGCEMTRIETFTDAAFAFAITMLVISVDQVPDSYEEMMGLLRDVPAFIFASAIMLNFWYAHHTWSRRYGLDDVPTALISFALVLTTLVYVFPLRFMAVTFAWAASGGYLASTPPQIESGDVNKMVLTYSIGFIVMCLCLVLLSLHAYRCRKSLQLSQVEQFDTVCDALAWSIVAATGWLAIVLALWLGPNAPGIPAFSFMLLPVIMPIFGVVTTRKRRRRFGANQPTSR